MVDRIAGVVAFRECGPVYFTDKITIGYDSLDQARDDVAWIDGAMKVAEGVFLRKLAEGFLCTDYRGLVRNRLYQDDDGAWRRDLSFEYELRAKP